MGFVNTLVFKDVEEAEFELAYMTLFKSYYDSEEAKTSGNRYLYAKERMVEIIARLGNRVCIQTYQENIKNEKHM